MQRNKLLLLLALLLTAATGAWAQDAKHLITATYREQTRSLEQPLPYATTIGELYEAVTGEPFSDLISTMSSFEMPLTGISSNNTSAVSIGEINGASTPVTVNADGKATISINFGSYAYGIFVSVTSPLYAYMKDGVKDADKWTVKVGDGQAQALPIGGLKGDGSETVTLTYTGRLKVKGVKATSDAAAAEAAYTLLSAATTADCGKVVCAAGHLHDAKTAVPDGCTAVGILGKVTETGHGLILALQDATAQTWNTINGWTSVTTYAGTTLKVLPDDAARGTNLTSYTALGETAVSNWAVAGDTDYQAIFKNLGGAIDDWESYVLDNNVNAYITTGVGGSALDGEYWTAWTSEELQEGDAVMFYINEWNADNRNNSKKIRPVLGFGGEAAAAKESATVTTAPTGAAVVGVGKTTALVSGGVAEGGTLMYAVTTTNTKPTSTDGFSGTVPTAQSITASGTVYVWYYVKGDDTHSDSEIAATAIEVPVADIVWDATNVSDLSVSGTYEPYEKEGVKLGCNANQIEANWNDYGNPTMDGIGFIARASGGYTFTAPDGKAFTKIEMKALGPAGWSNANLGTGWAYNNPTVTWTGSAASTVDLLKDANKFNNGTYISYIAFTLVDAE